MIDRNDRLFEILKRSLWGSAYVSSSEQNAEIPANVHSELRAQAVESLAVARYPELQSSRYELIAQFVWMVRAQDEAVKMLKLANIPVVVIKGTATGMYYPQPSLRTYGDIDLLVQTQNYNIAIQTLRKGDWYQLGEIGHYHTALKKGNQLIELHQCPPGLDDIPEGTYIREYLFSGFNNIQEGRIDQPNCTFPVLPWQQNGLEILWHFREHLYNGIGLRHVIDWMMFVHCCLDDQAFVEFRTVLEKASLLVLAKAVARMGQLYLGLSDTITWCKDVDDTLCDELMVYILDQGNFGYKRADDKAIKVLSRYHTPFAFLRGMQRKGMAEWQPAKEHKALQPFAWLYIGIKGVKEYLMQIDRSKFKEKKDAYLRRKDLLDRLYGKNRY